MRNYTIKALFFDLDNTLADRNLAAEKFMRQWLSGNCPGLKEGALEEEIARIMEKDDWGYTSRDLFFEWVVSNYTNGMQKVTRESLAEQYFTIVPRLIQAYEQSMMVLERLQENYPLALLTNGGGHTQRSKLVTTGLGRFFHDSNTFISGEIGKDKPAPEIFERALRHLNMEGPEALMVGDHPLNDIQGARSAGLRTCWISHGRRYPEEYAAPDHTIAAIADLLTLL